MAAGTTRPEKAVVRACKCEKTGLAVPREETKLEYVAKPSCVAINNEKTPALLKFEVDDDRRLSSKRREGM